MCAMNPRLLRPLATGLNPRQIAGLGLWLDANDASTLTLNGGNVSEWRDKSGSGRDFAQDNAARQPPIGTMNGKDALSFAGHQLIGNTVSKSLLRNVPGATVIVAASSVDGTFRTLFLVSTGTGSVARCFLGQSATPSPWLLGGRRVDADSFSSLEWTGSSSPSGPHVLSSVLDYGNSDAYLYGDGTLVNSTTSFLTDGNTSDTDSQDVSIGSSPGFIYLWSGLLAEVLVWPRVLTDAERQSVERHLGSKWGITLA